MADYVESTALLACYDQDREAALVALEELNATEVHNLATAARMLIGLCAEVVEHPRDGA